MPFHRNTGGFSRIDTLMGALWVALGHGSTYQVSAGRHGFEKKLTIFPAGSFVAIDLFEHPPLTVTLFQPLRRNASSPPPHPQSAGKIRIVKPMMNTPQPGSSRDDVSMEVERLLCEDPRRVELIARVKSGNLNVASSWQLRLRWTGAGSSLEPRILTLRP
jgi:hypothetical protein